MNFKKNTILNGIINGVLITFCTQSFAAPGTAPGFDLTHWMSSPIDQSILEPLALFEDPDPVQAVDDFILTSLEYLEKSPTPHSIEDEDFADLIFSEKIQAVKKAFWRSSGTPQYLKGLDHFQSRFTQYHLELLSSVSHSSHPGRFEILQKLEEFLFNLGFQLQLEWQKQIPPSLRIPDWTQSVRSQQSGLILGSIASALLVFKSIRNPTSVPALFKVLRFTLPALGAQGGLALGYTFSQSSRNAALRDLHLPPAPAQILTFIDTPGEPGFDLTEFELRKLIASGYAGLLATPVVAGATALVDSLLASSTLAASAPPLAIAMLSVVALISISWVIYSAAESWAEAQTTARVRQELRTPVINSALAALRSKSTLEALKNTQNLHAATLAFSNFLNRPIESALLNYGSARETLLQGCLQSDPEFKALQGSSGAEIVNAQTLSALLSRCLTKNEQKLRPQLEAQDRELADTAQAFLTDLHSPFHAEYEAYQSREVLRAVVRLSESTDLNEEALKILGQGLSRIGQDRMRITYSNWKKCFEPQHLAKRTSSKAACDVSFLSHLDALEKADDHRLSNQVQSGKLQEHPTHLLFQVSALIRSTQRASIEYLAAQMIQQVQLLDASLAQYSGLSYSHQLPLLKENTK